jgi:hypothetical protein
MKEIWKDIPNYNGYQVSNLGRVRTYNKTSKTDRHGIRKWKDRILRYKGQNYHTGYRVDLWKDGKPNTLLVARITAFTFLDNDINNHYLTVNHIDGNRMNNKIDNLELISLADNIRHAFKNGLNKMCKKIKLTNKISKEVITFYSMNQADLFMNKKHGYISNLIIKNKYENKMFKWEVIK